MKHMQNAPAAPSLTNLSQVAGATRTYYSIAEVAAMLGVSRVSVWRWISSGRLPVTRLGHRTVRVKRDDLLQIVRPSRTGSVATPPLAANTAAPPEHDGDHVVMFYEADRFLVDGVVDFIGPALKAGERAIVVATAEHRASIEAGLRDDGIDMSQMLADGSYVAVDAARTLARFLIEDVPDPARFEAVLNGLLRRSNA